MLKSWNLSIPVMVTMTLFLMTAIPAFATDCAHTQAGKYVCACGEVCSCNHAADHPGNCPCGKPVVQMQAGEQCDKKADCPMEEKEAKKAGCACCNKSAAM